jgi:hypothetical protein
MAGCDAHNDGGDSSAGVHRVELWTAIIAIIGAAAALALFLSLGPLGSAAVVGILAGAVAGAALGFFIGSAVDWFTRLKEQNPNQITISGTVACAGTNPFGLQPFSDGDWTSNITSLGLLAPPDLPITAPGATTQVDEVRLRAAPGSGLAHAFRSYNEDSLKTPILHCEISAHAGAYSVVGGAIGSGLGAAAGVAAGVAACAALGIFTFGIGAALCLMLVAIAVAAGAVLGGAAGDLVGAAIGTIVDELSDFDKLGKTIEAFGRCIISLTGKWVTDTSHQPPAQRNPRCGSCSGSLLLCFRRYDQSSGSNWSGRNCPSARRWPCDHKMMRGAPRSSTSRSSKVVLCQNVVLWFAKIQNGCEIFVFRV